jgi:hypothetical protein
VAVADESEVFALGVVNGDTEDIAGIPSALEDGANVDVLISIDGLCFARCFHGTEKIPFYGTSEHPPKQSGELEP